MRYLKRGKLLWSVGGTLLPFGKYAHAMIVVPTRRHHLPKKQSIFHYVVTSQNRFESCLCKQYRKNQGRFTLVLLVATNHNSEKKRRNIVVLLLLLVYFQIGQYWDHFLGFRVWQFFQTSGLGSSKECFQCQYSGELLGSLMTNAASEEAHSWKCIWLFADLISNNIKVTKLLQELFFKPLRIDNKLQFYSQERSDYQFGSRLSEQ